MRPIVVRVSLLVVAIAVATIYARAADPARAVDPAYVSNVSPGAVVPGATVLVTGFRFTGTTSVTVGATAASFAFVSDTQLQVTVPALVAGAYDITVTTGAGPNTPTDFTRLIVLSTTARQWTGLGGDNLWSNAANWDAGGVPAAGSDLVFNAGAARPTSQNDLAAGTSFHSLSFTGGLPQRVINGQPFKLTAGLNCTDGSDVILQGDIEFQGNQVVHVTGANGGGHSCSVRAYGAISMPSQLTVFSTGNLDIYGVISGAGSIVKQAFGNLTLFNDNTYTGTTTINGGNVVGVSANFLGSNVGGTVLNYASITVWTGSNVFGISENITLSNNSSLSIINGYGNPTQGGAFLSGAITLDGPFNFLSVDNSVQVTGLISGTGGFYKQGPGTLDLNAPNTYTGSTTVQAGELTVGHLQPSSNIDVFGTLSGGGQAGDVHVMANGQIRASNSGSTSILQMGSLLLDPNAKLTALLCGGNPGPGTGFVGGYDRLVVNGTVTLGGALLSLDCLSQPRVDGRELVLIANDGVDPISGTLAGVPDGANLRGFHASYHGGDGNDFSLTYHTPTTRTVYRPSNGYWFTHPAGGGTWWGLPGDIPVPGDYDGDGTNDIAVNRPSNGYWYVIRSSDSVVTATWWGVPGDVPLQGDFDGDGKADIAVYRPSNGFWYIINSSDSTVTSTWWGISGDIPVPGDFDGDGRTDIAVLRPSNGYWYILRSSDSGITATWWAATGDVPVPGDYDGDGKTDLAVYRPSNGYWYVLRSSDAGLTATWWGLSGDIPEPGDYDSDGKTDIVVYRPSDGYWYQQSPYTADWWGIPGDVPLSLPYIVRNAYYP